jgi:hypothetical protein
MCNFTNVPLHDNLCGLLLRQGENGKRFCFALISLLLILLVSVTLLESFFCCFTGMGDDGIGSGISPDVKTLKIVFNF